MNSLYLAPHSDDEALWGAFTIMREKPLVLVITDSWIQWNRGEDINAEQRWIETKNAMKILGAPVMRLGIRDDSLWDWAVREVLQKFAGFDTVYAPAVQGGNNQHDMIAIVADQVFGEKVVHYTTYTKEEPYTTGDVEVVPFLDEIEKKNMALDCYFSQLKNTNRVYFDAVRGKSEWLCSKNVSSSQN